MAQQEIRYNGQTARPDDYSSKDGDLALSLNLISEDGALHPLHEPQTVFTLPDGCRVVFVHATATFKHYIVADADGQLYWIEGDTTGTVSQLNNPIGENDISGATSVTAVGNTLVVLTDTAMHYVLWKNNNYAYLGTHLPELPLSFSLEGKAIPANEQEYEFEVNLPAGKISYNYYATSCIFKNLLSNSEIKDITEKVMAKVNAFVEDKSNNDGKFLFPFFVRYAYRLFDGTLTMQSSPVLMVTSSWQAPQPFITDYTSEIGYVTKLKVQLAALACDLSYKVCESSYKTALQDWGDIVQSVDIFISAPIYTYNQAGNVEGWCYWSDVVKGYTLARIKKSDSKIENTDVYWGDSDYSDADYCNLYITRHLITNYTINTGRGLRELLLPQYSQDDLKNRIKDTSLFYKFQSIKLEDIATERTVLSVPKDYLKSITSRELMTDDYDSHDTLIPENECTNNSRLMLYNISKRLAAPLAVQAYSAYTNKFYIYNGVELSNSGIAYLYYSIFVHIKRNDEEFIVGYKFNESSLPLNEEQSVLASFCRATQMQWGEDIYYYTHYFPIKYFYYPDPNAYKVTVKMWREVHSPIVEPFNEFSFPLERHTMLNGAVYFNGWEPNIQNLNTVVGPTVSNNAVVQQPNKLYLSALGNPYYFPASSINTVGTGTIQAVATVNEPVSQGQFGHSDIYIFTTDGLWVAKIMADGKLESINPVSQDVCTNPAAVVQLAKTVLFPTQRGIMAVAGSRIEPLSDTIDTDNPFNLAALPHLTDPNVLPAALGTPALPPFQHFIDGCKMLFDYQHQRVVVFNPAVDDNDQRLYPYAYVYSLRSKQWGMMQSDLTDTFNAYSDAMAMSGNAVVTLNTDSTFGNQLFVTRPFKLGLPDVLKTIRAMIQRGMFSRGHVKCILYGSRDLVHWQVVGSSMGEAIRRMSGSGYKYFRVAVISTLAASETLTGATVEAVPKHTNLLI